MKNYPDDVNEYSPDAPWNQTPQITEYDVVMTLGAISELESLLNHMQWTDSVAYNAVIDDKQIRQALHDLESAVKHLSDYYDVPLS